MGFSPFAGPFLVVFDPFGIELGGAGQGGETGEQEVPGLTALVCGACRPSGPVDGP